MVHNKVHKKKKSIIIVDGRLYYLLRYRRSGIVLCYDVDSAHSAVVVVRVLYVCSTLKIII